MSHVFSSRLALALRNQCFEVSVHELTSLEWLSLFSIQAFKRFKASAMPTIPPSLTRFGINSRPRPLFYP